MIKDQTNAVIVTALSNKNARAMGPTHLIGYLNNA
jgi:hypothetical protein